MLIALAGFAKEREQAANRARTQETLVDHEHEASAVAPRASGAAPAGGVPPSTFKLGLCVCILSGVLSPMLNFSLSFGNNITKLASHRAVVVVAAGANASAAGGGGGGGVTCALQDAAASASNAVWVVGVGAGAAVNVAYTFFLLARSGSWRKFAPSVAEMAEYYAALAKAERPPPFYVAGLGGAANFLYPSLSGALWFGGNLLYSAGASRLGSLGTALGWPLFISSMILAGNASGVAFGEWAGVNARARGLMALGNLLLIAAVIVASAGTA